MNPGLGAELSLFLRQLLKSWKRHDVERGRRSPADGRRNEVAGLLVAEVVDGGGVGRPPVRDGLRQRREVTKVLFSLSAEFVVDRNAEKVKLEI